MKPRAYDSDDSPETSGSKTGARQSRALCSLAGWLRTVLPRCRLGHKGLKFLKRTDHLLHLRHPSETEEVLTWCRDHFLKRGSISLAFKTKIEDFPAFFFKPCEFGDRCIRPFSPVGRDI
jgi:hypothetical protein